MPILPFLPAIIGAGATIGGALLSGHKKTTTDQTQNATFDPAATQVRNTLAPIISGRLTQPASLDPALLAGGLTGINQSFNSAIPQMQDIFSSRGLGSSGLFGGNIQNAGLSRLGQIGQLYQQVMGTAYNRQSNNIAQAQQFAAPTGSTGTSVTKGPGTAAGLGGGLSDIGTLLGIMQALKGGSNPSGIVGAVPDISAITGNNSLLGSGLPTYGLPDINTGSASVGPTP